MGRRSENGASKVEWGNGQCELERSFELEWEPRNAKTEHGMVNWNDGGRKRLVAHARPTGYTDNEHS